MRHSVGLVQLVEQAVHFDASLMRVMGLGRKWRFETRSEQLDVAHHLRSHPPFSPLLMIVLVTTVDLLLNHPGTAVVQVRDRRNRGEGR